jgi:hypothetical protein
MGWPATPGIVDLVSELAPLHPRDNTFPGEVFLQLAADALDWCGARRSGPLAAQCNDGAGDSAGMPPCAAERAARPVRNREAPLAMPPLAWLS